MQHFENVLILSDGIGGHYHQSLGIANWLVRLGGSKLMQSIEVPKDKALKIKLSSKKLMSGDSKYADEWLNTMDFHNRDFGTDTLFISAGSSAAPFCLALARATGNKAAVIMTPSVLGTRPFDFAIIPEHDKQDPLSNVITTLGAPNHIYEPELKKTALEFFADKDFSGKKVIALLIGGSDANYKVTAEWAKKALEPFKKIHDAKLLVTTSRRTGSEVDEVIGEILRDCEALEYLLLMSKGSALNSLTAMLGAATHVFATEDSVSMVSEAATAGFRVGLLRVPHSPVTYAKNLAGYGIKRFDAMFDRMKSLDLITDIVDEKAFSDFVEASEQKHHKDFNEARKAAEWILNS